MLIVRRLANRPKGSLPVTAEWIDDLSIERYRPMIRLLDGEDLEFLRAQPGYTPKMASRLRIQRCQIFRGYLRCLHTDFKRVCIAIKVLMLQSGHDREDLASALVRSQMQFALGMARVQVQLMLYRWGLSGVDVGELLSVFDVMRLELRSLVPAGIEA
ncbi:MAG TPA: hypothetical protein VG675_23060 [Bryobacteraceae bacterium]|nr:hypothetical protein [Bryobacteraceae bacterium]